MLDIEETVHSGDAVFHGTGINQPAPLGPRSESTVIDPKLVPLIEELASRGYDSREEFNKFLGTLKRARKFQGRNSDLLRVYASWLRRKHLNEHPVACSTARNWEECLGYIVRHCIYKSVPRVHRSRYRKEKGTKVYLQVELLLLSKPSESPSELPS